MRRLTYNITPVSKPRMTQSDRWKKRPAVVKYWKFCDLVTANNITIPDQGAVVRFHLPMPKSWSIKKRKAMCCMPHKQTPDIDNLLKALLDAVFKNDKHVYDIRALKTWSVDGKIVIEYY